MIILMIILIIMYESNMLNVFFKPPYEHLMKKKYLFNYFLF